MENLNNYVAAHTPDRMRIAKMLTNAKGPDRTMAEFATDCGVSPSTFSRILNLKMTRPLSDEMVLSILEHKWERSHIELEDLMHANGKITLEEKEKEEKSKKENSPFLSGSEYKEKKIKARDILITELVYRDVKLQVHPCISPLSLRSEKPQNKYDLPIRGEFSFSCELPAEAPKKWIFSSVGSFIDETGRSTRLLNRRFLRDYATVFLMDEWDPDSMKDMKYSFLFWDAEYYSSIVEMLNQRKFNNEISAILMDLENGCVAEETIFPMTGKKEPKSIFDLKPTILFPDEAEEFWNRER